MKKSDKSRDMKQMPDMSGDEIRSVTMKIIKTSDWQDKDGVDQKTFVLGYKGRVIIFSTLKFEKKDYYVSEKLVVFNCQIDLYHEEYTNKEGQLKKGIHLKKKLEISQLIEKALVLDEMKVSDVEICRSSAERHKLPLKLSDIINNIKYTFECFDTSKGPGIKLTLNDFYLNDAFWMSQSLRNNSEINSADELKAAIDKSPSSFVLDSFDYNGKVYYRIYKRKVKNIIKSKKEKHLN